MLELLRNSPPPAHRQSWDWEELRRSALANSLQVLKSHQDAEDATQEALLRAWRARDRCDANDGPRPWMGRIARNEALRLGARLSQRRRREGEALSERIADGSASPDDRPARPLV